MMDEKTYKRWTEIKNNGKMKYVIIYGIGLWGIPVGLLTVFFAKCTVIWQIVLYLIIFIGAGIVFGHVMWRHFEKQAKKYETQHEGKEE